MRPKSRCMRTSLATAVIWSYSSASAASAAMSAASAARALGRRQRLDARRLERVDQR
jgi:hypothetical protein